jgi:hypothetical protein
VRLAQSTDGIGACHWLKIQPTLVRLAQSTDEIGAIGSKHSRHW